MLEVLAIVSHEVVDLGGGHYQLRVVSRHDGSTWAHVDRPDDPSSAALLLRDLPLRDPAWVCLDK
jgi:hypothetical protein